MNQTIFQAYKKKIPLLLLMYFLGGTFCRWYQLKNELLFDGSLAEGAYMQKVLPLLALSFIAGFGFMVYGLKNIPDHRNCFPGTATMAVALPAGLFLIAGNACRLLLGADIANAYTEVSAALTRILPYLGILAGICFILFGTITKSGKTPTPLLFMAVSIYLVVRLIVCFQEWNMDPSIHDYGYKLLASIFTMLGCFQIAGFGFGKGKRRITILWCLCAAYFNTISLPDHLMQDPVEGLIAISLLLLTGISALLLLYAPDPPEETPAEELPSEDTAPIGPELPQ